MTERVGRFGEDLGVGFVAGDLELAAAMDAMPVDSLWVGGHVASPNPTPEVMVGLTRLAAATRRVRVGSAVLLLPLYPPAIVAKQVADLDRAAGGRVILGVGVGGEYPQEFCACQVPVGERGSRTNEAIPLLRELWTAEPVNHRGRHYPMTDVRVHPPPLQPGGPPIVVAGRKQPAMRRAATLGDGWMPYLYSPRRYATSVTAIRSMAAEKGRDLSGFGWFAFVFVSVHADGDTARRAAASALGGRYNQDFRAMVDNVTAAGTPVEVTTKLKDFVDAGVRHFVFLPISPGDQGNAVTHRLLDDVIPEIRTHAQGALQ